MTPHMTRTTTGVVKFFNQPRGYAFLSRDDTGGQIFAHISQFVGDFEPNHGDRVAFIVGTGRDGRPAAQKIRIIAP
jgi:cold shock protein